MNVYVQAKSIPIAERELRSLELRLENLRKNVEGNQEKSWDIDYTQFMDLEMSKIDEAVNICHEKIDEMKSTGRDMRELIWSDLEFCLSDLNQKIIQMENCCEDYNQYREYINFF